MEAKLTKDKVIDYLNNIHPDPGDFQEVARTSNELKEIINVVLNLNARLNETRKVKLLKTETALLRVEVERLEEDIATATELNEDYQQLLAQKEKLLADKDNISDLSRQRDEIVQLEALVARHNVAQLRGELLQMQMHAQMDIRALNGFVLEAIPFFTGLAGDFVQETRDLFAKLKQRQLQINEIIAEANEVLHNEQLVLSARLKDHSHELSEALTAYNALSGQLTAVKMKLLETRQNHQKNVAVYQLHFEQNKNIYGELGKQHQLDRHLTSLFETIEKELRLFDLEIKTLVENADQITVF